METAIAAGLRRPAASARLQAKLHHATLLVEQARAGKQAARRLGQAERQVASVVPLVRRLAHRGAIAGDLGARLASLASEAIDVLKRLRAATRHP
jgi:ABC-type transporter Mla subunit MlaD